MEPKETSQNLGSGKQHYLKWKNWLEAYLSTAGEDLKKTQARYKRDFDSRLCIPRPKIRTGAQIFVRKDYANPRTETKHKLAPVATRPYKVLEAVDYTVVIRTLQGRMERISHDRVVVAPPQEK